MAAPAPRSAAPIILMLATLTAALGAQQFAVGSTPVAGGVLLVIAVVLLFLGGLATGRSSRRPGR